MSGKWEGLVMGTASYSIFFYVCAYLCVTLVGSELSGSNG